MAEDTSSPNEAMIAARKARILMDKHQISKSDVESVIGDQFAETKASKETKKAQTWLRILTYSVAKLNDCRAVLGWNGLRLYQFQGFKSDAIVAKLTMDYLIEACERACSLSKTKGRSEKNYFRLGFVQSVNDRINEIVKERTETFVDKETGNSLIPVKSAMIAEHFGDLSSAKSPEVRSPNETEEKAFFDGLINGNKVGLEKQVHGTESAKLTNERS